MCRWARNSHQCSLCWSFRCIPPTATLFTAAGQSFIAFHVLKFKCGKHYQDPPWLFFVVEEREGRVSPPSSPPTSFLLWNVSNGQRLTSDWLNSKTISFVLLFLFENAYQFSQGKKGQSHLVRTHHGVSGWGARTPWARWMCIFEQKGQKWQNLTGFKGQQVVATSQLWSCSVVWRALWLSLRGLEMSAEEWVRTCPHQQN